jgi:hypothetical protein
MEADMDEKGIVPGDLDVRLALRSRLLRQHAREADTAVIDELGLCRGQVRLDVAVVNGTLDGYEIKSDRDSLRRLSGQVEVYGKVLDRVTLVVGDRHVHEALEIVPAWWGVLHIGSTTRGLKFKAVRGARKNPSRDPRALVELLWLDDAVALLEERNAARGVRGKPRHIVWDRVCRHFSLDEIGAAVRSRLKAKTTRRSPA